MAERLERFRQVLKPNKIDAMLITNPVNRRYLSSFEGSGGVLLISEKQACLVTDFRYIDQAAGQAKQFQVRRWQDDLYQCMDPIIAEAGWKRLGFEAKDVVYSTYHEMKDKLPVELVPVENAVEQQRMVKSKQELDALRRGTEVLDRAFEYICNVIKPGMAEKDLALDLEIYLRRQGAEEPSFRFIVASGKRGAMPHGTASGKAMQVGELVTIDFGAVFAGYATDMTRTLCLGKPDQQQRQIYELVREGQKKAADAVKPGLKGSELDKVARTIFERAGYAQYFGHGLGHGVGLETHEQPVLNPRSATILEPGMVITVEPGIYIPDWGGVRIEDMVAVTDRGGDVLTKSPRELITVN